MGEQRITSTRPAGSIDPSNHAHVYSPRVVEREAHTGTMPGTIVGGWVADAAERWDSPAGRAVVAGDDSDSRPDGGK